MATEESLKRQGLWDYERAQPLSRSKPDLPTSKERVYREALECLLPGLILDLRYANDDDDKDAMRSRIQTVTEALAYVASDETKALHREGTEPVSRLAGDIEWCLARINPQHKVYSVLAGVATQLHAQKAAAKCSYCENTVIDGGCGWHNCPHSALKTSVPTTENK